MNMDEYLSVKNFTYLEYCDYLQDKYGIGLDDYMTKNWNKKQKCSRTNDGLIAHHKKEDTMILLSTKEVAKICPFEWQLKENIVYCDYLEHLLLHVLIRKYPADKDDKLFVGLGGIIDYLVPELNDLYSGWETKQKWRKNCHDKVKDDKAVYLEILEQFIDIEFSKENSMANINNLCKSFNSKYGLWKENKNEKLYDEIKLLIRIKNFQKLLNERKQP